MKNIYCLPIIKSASADVLELIDQQIANYHYFEVWVDYLEDLDDTFLTQLADRLGERLIIVFRRQKLEPTRLPLDRRLAIISGLTGSCFIDLDITSQTEELKQAVNLKVIASYHDYQQTPDSVQLRSIIDTMEAYRPSVYKLATFCNQPQDALRLLELLTQLKTTDRSAIVLGMGEYGQITRIFGSLWGNQMVFAPLDDDTASAPGQLTRNQLTAIFKELGV